MDKLTKKARSANRAAIKSKNTKPEPPTFNELKKKDYDLKNIMTSQGSLTLHFPKKEWWFLVAHFSNFDGRAFFINISIH